MRNLARLLRLNVTLAVLAAMSMFTDGADPDPADPPAAPPAPPTPPAVDEKAIRKAARDAEAAAEKRLLEQLGVTDPAEAKKIIDAARARVDAEKDEIDRARDEAAAAKTEADQARAELAAERHDRAIAAALAAADLPAKHAARAARLLDTAVGADADTIAADVASLKEDWPELFDTAPAAPAGAPGSTPPAPKPKHGPKTELDQGADLYAALFPKAQDTPTIDQLINR